MNFVKYAKMALIAGFAVVSLMGQPIVAQAEETGSGGNIYHGVTVLAWARVDGVSPSTDSSETTTGDDVIVDGRIITAGNYDTFTTVGSTETTTGDDVIVDGRIITGENPDSSTGNDNEWKYVNVRR
jgi:hypothetical protein